MNLPAAIKTLYPTATADDYELRDDGDGAGPYLALWNDAKLGPAPRTVALLAEATTVPEPAPEAAPATPALAETDEFRAKRSQQT